MVFTVSYGSVTRELTRHELEKAPKSLLANILLVDKTVDKGTLVISSDGTPGAWAQGSEDVFKVAIACYTKRSDHLKQQPTLQRLQEALSGYFIIPEFLWPFGVSLAQSLLDLAVREEALAQKLIADMHQVMSNKLHNALGDRSAQYTTNGPGTEVCWTETFVVTRGKAIQYKRHWDSQASLNQPVEVHLESRNLHNENNEYMTAGLQAGLIRVSMVQQMSVAFERLQKCEAFVKLTVRVAR